MPIDHTHRLQRCHDCDGDGIQRWADGWPLCDSCEGRGYLRPEFCEVCGEPMGNLRRGWKREGRPMWDARERVRRWYARRSTRR